MKGFVLTQKSSRTAIIDLKTPLEDGYTITGVGFYPGAKSVIISDFDTLRKLNERKEAGAEFPEFTYPGPVSYVFEHAETGKLDMVSFYCPGNSYPVAVIYGNGNLFQLIDGVHNTRFEIAWFVYMHFPTIQQRIFNYLSIELAGYPADHADGYSLESSEGASAGTVVRVHDKTAENYIGWILETVELEGKQYHRVHLANQHKVLEVPVKFVYRVIFDN